VIAGPTRVHAGIESPSGEEVALATMTADDVRPVVDRDLISVMPVTGNA
jgi:hypothetical protein